MYYGVQISLICSHNHGNTFFSHESLNIISPTVCLFDELQLSSFRHQKWGANKKTLKSRQDLGIGSRQVLNKFRDPLESQDFLDLIIRNILILL